ncbi:MAG: (deoxy)nucleoside triphosphate pyrophosphohydrolase [Candidatus Pseudobacter hemicellulosilyticus]|uniref:8-oxo-dGTP diphosphatase n=1 Tax=Candidatus Pseudobacter hemicellulosilyticus TaxID=3121375 RepID=A0AAJ5WQ09_9BACT|nr:MAG: (deoxy)nucleoside triphosphate pyrophosphohydrolase [Pseudobacter sp.]
MDIIKVVCGVIFKDGKVLLCRRKPAKSLGGYWEFPGGKVEPGEQEQTSLLRELEEELGMKVNIEGHFKTVVHAYDAMTIQLIAYTCLFQEASFVLTDHDSYEWVNKADLKNWKLAPADIPIANDLMVD